MNLAQSIRHELNSMTEEQNRKFVEIENTRVM